MASAHSAPKQIHRPPFFNDVHSTMQNLLAELAVTKEKIIQYEDWNQKNCDKIRKEVQQEVSESRESMNKFRYEFDDLVHKRVETVLEGLEEMEQNQKYKDRQQQEQLDNLEEEMRTLKSNLGAVNAQWVRFKNNSMKRSRLTRPPKAKDGTEQRHELGAKLEAAVKEEQEKNMYATAEVMRIRLKGAAQFLRGEEWERVIRDHDVDGSGQIGYQEFRKLCREELGLKEPEQQLKLLFSCLDADNSGEIGVTELLEYVADPAQRMRTRLQRATEASGHTLKRLLDNLDQDKSGQISFAEFRSLCRDTLKLLDKDVHLQAVFKAMDSDQSGEISIKELTAWVEKK